MSRPQLILKQSTGWFAAGWQFGQALGELSDAAFKLYAWLCMNANRHSGQLQGTVPELSSALKKPDSWTESALRELLERGVCWWMKADALEIADQYWPYQRRAREAESKDYVGEVSNSTNVGAGFPEVAFAPISRFSLPPSRWSSAAVRLIPFLRASSAAADHNSSGIGLFPCRFRLHSSNRARTSSIVSNRLLLRIATPPPGITGRRTTLPAMPGRFHAALRKAHGI
jgi:hypothetical protein